MLMDKSHTFSELAVYIGGTVFTYFVWRAEFKPQYPNKKEK
jgi:hypothetical protein